MSKYTCEPSLR